MSSENFAYWLNGYLEISGATSLDSFQLKIIKDHLATVFNKVTPDYRPAQWTPRPEQLGTAAGDTLRQGYSSNIPIPGLTTTTGAAIC